MNKLITLDNLGKAKIMIYEAKNIDELKKIKDTADALRAYAVQQGYAIEIQNDINEISMRAKRRMGEISLEIPGQKGNQYAKSDVRTKLNILENAGISKQRANEYEKIAGIPADKFEGILQEAKIESLKITNNMLVNIAKEAEKQELFKDKQQRYSAMADGFNNKDIQIWQGEFQKESKRIEDNSVDLILTDPPYPEEFLPLWEDMFSLADRILKPSKFLVCYANHQNLDKIFRLANNLKYYWIFKIDFTRKPIAMGRNLIATWKPIIIYQKLPFKKRQETIEDSIKFDYTERELHDKNWGQTIQPFEYLLEKFSEPNDLVFEPFAGTGTTLLACKNKKRRCIGVELEEKYINIIRGRLNE